MRHDLQPRQPVQDARVERRDAPRDHENAHGREVELREGVPEGFGQGQVSPEARSRVREPLLVAVGEELRAQRGGDRDEHDGSGHQRSHSSRCSAMNASSLSRG